MINQNGKKWTSYTISDISQLKNAITELLNMNSINNQDRCNELKPKIDTLFRLI